MFNFAKEIAQVKKMTALQRASDLKFTVNYIREKHGDQAVDKIIKAVEEEIGQMPDYKKIKDMEWLPAIPIHLFTIMAVKILNWQEKDIVECAYAAITMHKLNRWLVRYLVSVKKFLSHAQKDHRMHNSQGDFELISCDDKNKKAVLRFKNYLDSKIFDIYFKGLYLKLIRLNTGSKNVKIVVKDCSNAKRVCRDFVISW